MQTLVTEVRQLRQTLILIHHLGLQQQHVDALSRQLDQIREQLARSAQESKALTAELTAKEARLAREQESGYVRHDIEDEIKKVKVVMDERSVRDQQQQPRESQPAGQLQAEQSKLNELNDRLDWLERAIQPAAGK